MQIPMNRTRAWLELDSAALSHNLQCVRRSTTAQVMAVIKADAYGHGQAFAAQVLQAQVDAFAVATLDEAVTLRAQCPDIPITMLSGLYAPAQLDELIGHAIRPVIFNRQQVDWIAERGGYDAPVWLKIDTGMGRLGLNPDELDEAVSVLSSRVSEIGLMSHFASADTPDAQQNEQQHQCFEALGRGYSLSRSFANSAAILSRPQDHYDLVRPGIMLYGSAPLAGKTAAQLGLRPVMALYARLIEMKQLKAGDSVGYSATWTADQDCTLGVVSIGYGDGYPRVVADGAEVAIDGKRYPLIGRVSMDSLAILLDQSTPVRIGARVELWGNTISVDEVASWAGTIGYELLCKVTSRPARYIL